MNDLDTMQRTVGEWASRTFPDSSESTILAHLVDEAGELQDSWAFPASEHDPDPDIEEAADCFLLLLHYAHRRRFSLFDAAMDKHAKNQTRTWETTKNERGYFKHVDLP